jgi:phospholipid/cholesterol/gamma-HCH transport system substrate-binding protein
MIESNPKGFMGRLAIVVVASLLMLVTLFGLAYMGGALHFSAADYHIDAVLPTSSAMIPGARVTMAGAQVGQVASIHQQGNGAVVQLDITDHAVTPIPADSQVALREVTAIGENYVQITPGTSKQMLSSGAVLPMSQSDQYVDVDQIMSTLQGSTSQRARQLIQGLGDALAGHGQDLNGTIAGVSNTFHPLANVVQILNGDRSYVDQLVSELGDVASAAGERGQSIIQLASSGLTTFRALATENQHLSATLDQLPSTLSQVRTTANTLNDVTNTAAPVVTKLASTLHDLRPAITSLKPAADEGHEVLDDLDTAAPKLQTTLTRLRTLSPPAASALPQITDLLCQVNPMLRYIQPDPSNNSTSYVQDLTSFISWFGSAVNAYDDISHLVRIVPILGDNSVVGLPPAVSTATEQLLHAGILGNTTALTWNPYPKPGQIGTEHADAANDDVIGPSDYQAKTGYVYPHITSDCGGDGS